MIWIWWLPVIIPAEPISSTVQTTGVGASAIAGGAVTAGMAARVQWGWGQQCCCRRSRLWLLSLCCLHVSLVGRHGVVGLPCVCVSSASPLFPHIPSPSGAPHCLSSCASVRIHLSAHASLHHVGSCLPRPFVFIYLYRIVSINKL